MTEEIKNYMLETLKHIRMENQELITTLGIRAEEYKFLRNSLEYQHAQRSAEELYLWLAMTEKVIRALEPDHD